MARSATATGFYKRGRVWYVRTDPLTGRQLSTGKATLGAAREWYAVRERLAEDPTWVAGAQWTLKEALDELLKYKAPRVAKATQDYHKATRVALERILDGETPIVAIRPGEVDQFVRERRDEGVSDSTIWREANLLRQSLSMAKRAGKYPHDVATLLPEDLHQTYTPGTRVLKVDDVARLIGALETMDAKRGTEKSRARKVAVLKLAISLGLRPGEVWRLRREHFDLKAMTVEVPGTKNSQSRQTVPVLAPFHEWIKQAEKLLPLPKWANAVRDLNRIARQAVDPEFPHFTLRDLRRSFSTALIASGVDRDRVWRLMRHADGGMVDRVYGKPSAEELRKLAEHDLSRFAGSTVPKTLQRRKPDARKNSKVKGK